MLLEVAVFNIQSAITAQAAGADRLELCENPYDGGTTPSFGNLKTVREKIIIPAFPIIRPRGGDFLYTEEEYDVILKDILLIKELGFDGLVVGMLKADGNIDKEMMSKVVELAYPLEVTFHRAFDRAKDPLKALNDIIDCGCQRILTSGQVPNAFDGKELIRQLVTAADDKIIIMPGSGVRSNNIEELANFTGAVEFHSSARKLEKSQMNFLQTTMLENLDNVNVDTEEIKQMRRALTQLS